LVITSKKHSIAVKKLNKTKKGRAIFPFLLFIQ